MREKLIELICGAYWPIMNGDITVGEFCIAVDEANVLADHLIANGVTITPAVPGARIGHDMTEVCYRNGEEAMREKVIDYLRDQKGVTMGVIRSTIGDIIEKVRKL
jgi:hypothetical protein